MIIKNYKDLNKFIKKIIILIEKYLLKNKILIIIFKGNLGAGKTTIIKKIAKKFKIKETINSPTFVLWQIYKFKIKNNIFNFNHIDLYRIKAQNLLKLSLKSKINEKNNLFMIEWGEKLIPFLKKKRLKYLLIEIKILSAKKRLLKIKWKK